MNRNTDDQKNTNDTQGHVAKAGRFDEADTEGNAMKFRPEDKTDEADTEGNAAKYRPEDKTDEADTEGNALKGRP